MAPPKEIDPQLISLFEKIGLNNTKAKEAAGNINLSKQLKEIIEDSGINVDEGIDRSVGLLFYTMASKYPANAVKHRKLVIEYIIKKEIGTLNLQACLDYVKLHALDDIVLDDFKSTCGVGVVITNEQIKDAVTDYFTKHNSEILSKRYAYNFNVALGEIRTALKWADGKVLKDTLDATVLATLGDKSLPENAIAKVEKPKNEKPTTTSPTNNNNTTSTSSTTTTTTTNEEDTLENIKFPDPKDNIQNTKELLENHLKATGGKVVTRFPPEPNGYLHIGHAKAMFLDFGYAKKNGGTCYLRFDDTNPEKENQEYIDSIKDSVRWLGHEPTKITYSSDYFDQLYDLALELIRRGLAYVCFQPPAEIKSCREKMIDSPWRNTPVEENLKLFEDMRKGKFKEGEVTLRMKGDMKHANPCMRDMIAYRIKYHHHPMTGDKWCIYPSYDYSHCLVDSIENITHSLCTLEFEVRRLTYNWLVDVLGLYRPVVWEFARLNLTHILLSKRKIITMVQTGIVDGWDDPRLSTLNAFRRKGYTPESIQMLCETVGVTKANSTSIPYELLEHCLRTDLNEKATRAMVVLDPIKVIITNYAEGADEEITVPNIPGHPEKGTHKVDLSRVIYIERSDFRMEDSKDYYGLAPKKSVLLKYAYNVHCDEVIFDKAGQIQEIHVTMDRANTAKCKTIHWVSSKADKKPQMIEVRLYEHLFTDEEVGDNWVESVNPNSKKVVYAFADKTLEGSKEYDRFQFERTGYFCCDKDSTASKLVFNRTVSLKENKEKKVDPRRK